MADLAPKTIDDLHKMAANIIHYPFNADELEQMGLSIQDGFALYEYWKAHKDVGTFASPEYNVYLGKDDQGGDRWGRGLVTGRGVVLVWDGDVHEY